MYSSFFCTSPACTQAFLSSVLTLHLLQALVHAVSPLQLLSLPCLLLQASGLILYLPSSEKPYLTHLCLESSYPAKLAQVTAKFRLDLGLKKCHEDLIIFLSLGPISLVMASKRCSFFMVLRRLQWLQLPPLTSNLVGRVDILLQEDSN